MDDRVRTAEGFARPSREDRWWSLAVLTWLAGVSTYLFVVLAYRYASLGLGVRDLGFFVQSLWNSLHGRFLAVSFGLQGPHLWSEHFYLAHATLIPFYALWPSPLLLLAVQAAAAGIAGWGVFLLGRLWLGRAWLAAVPVLAYTLHPSVHGGALGLNIYGYHPDVLVPPLFILAVYFLAKHQTRAAVACWLLGLTVAEQYAVIWAGLGLFLAVGPTTRRLGMIMTAVSGAWLALATLVVIPSFAAGRWPYYFSGLQGLEQLTQAAAPAGGIEDLLAWHALAMARPFGYLPFLDAFSLIAAPVYLVYASAWKAGYSIPLFAASWHSAAVLPIMTVSLLRTLAGLSWFGSRLAPRLRERLLLGGVLAAALLPLVVNPSILLPSRYGLLPRDFTDLPPARRAALDQVHHLVPATARLATDFFTGSHFLHRQHLQLLRDGWADAEYLLVDQRHAFGGLWPPDRAAVNIALREPGAVRLFDREGFLLIRRVPRGPGTPGDCPRCAELPARST